MSVWRRRATSRMVALPEMLSLAPCFWVPSKRWAERMISPAAGSVPGIKARTFSRSAVSVFVATWARTVIFSFARSRRLRISPSRAFNWKAKPEGCGAGAAWPWAAPAGGACPGAGAGAPALHHAAPGHLERIEIGPRHADADDPQGPLLQGLVVGHHQLTFGDDDLAGDLGVRDLLGHAAPDPDELGRDVGRRAAG